MGPDQEHAQHPLGLLDRRLGAFLTAGEFEERVGAEELAHARRQDARELPAGAEEGLDLLEVLPVGVECALFLPLALQVFEVGLGRPRAVCRSWLIPFPLFKVADLESC